MEVPKAGHGSDRSFGPFYYLEAMTEEMPGIREEITNAFRRHRDFVPRLRQEPVGRRIERLRNLRGWIHKNRPVIQAAMYADFRKNPTEVDGIEIFYVLSEIKYALDNIEAWSAVKKVDATLPLLGTRSHIQYEPRGVCLIISPWNYPFSLCVGPLVSALAAGNAVMLKPSELTPHVAGVIKDMAEVLFEGEVVSVFEGDADVAGQLLKLPFDHIFFTGSPAVGKLVMKAASDNLASVTLELGGKSPVIVTESARIRETAQRIAFTKFLNNGQTCVAPDYILIDEKVKDHFIREIIEQTKNLFTEKDSPFEISPHYCRIVSDKHFQRLSLLLDDAVSRGAKPELSGRSDPDTRFIHPTILSHVEPDSLLMEQEIFGPILPIVSYHDLDEAIAIINNKPKPLGLYFFTQNKRDEVRILRETSAGGVCINDCGIQFMQHHLPFGGVNNSGLGKSHGHYGFLAFSNEKAVLKQRNGLTTIKAFHPPYTKWSKKIMDWFLKFF